MLDGGAGRFDDDGDHSMAALLPGGEAFEAIHDLVGIALRGYHAQGKSRGKMSADGRCPRPQGGVAGLEMLNGKEAQAPRSFLGISSRCGRHRSPRER